MASNPATVVRQDDALVFAGALDRAAAPGLWTAVAGIGGGVQRIVLEQVTVVDSAGLALLAELLARLRDGGASPRLQGRPAGLDELCAAYRLAPDLDYPA